MNRINRGDRFTRVTHRRPDRSYDNSEIIHGYGFPYGADEDFDNYWSEDSDFRDSQFRFDDELFGREVRERSLRERSRQDFRDEYRDSHFGKGPKGYMRSDDRIREEVCEILTQHRSIDASDIDVSVHDGIVTLRGEVEGRQMKRLAEMALDDVRGVRDVINHLSSYKSVEGWIPGIGDVAEDNNDSGIERALKSLDEKENKTGRI